MPGSLARVCVPPHEALARFAEPSIVEPALAALNDKETAVRIAAIHTLAEVQDQRTRKPLQAALQDNDAGVRLAALSDLLYNCDAAQLVPLLRTAVENALEELEQVLLNSLQALWHAPAVDGRFAVRWRTTISQCARPLP